MGRKLEFCRDEALHTAMQSFWVQGYEHTSMRDLASKLGLHLGSVYNALGDKQRVFEAVMRLHVKDYVIPALTALREAQDPLAALDNFFQRIVDECGSTEDTPGCFLINSLLNITNISDSVSAFLKEYLQLIEEAMADTVRRAQTAGSVPKELDAGQQAQALMSTMFGLRALAKLGTPPAQIQNVKDVAFRALACDCK